VGIISLGTAIGTKLVVSPSQNSCPSLAKADVTKREYHVQRSHRGYYSKCCTIGEDLLPSWYCANVPYMNGISHTYFVRHYCAYFINEKNEARGKKKKRRSHRS
jgi:hypothetical protein